MSGERDMKVEAKDIFDAALAAVAPADAVGRALANDPMDGSPFVIAVGKAASAMAQAARDAGAREGLIITSVTQARPRAGFEVLVGDHPQPGTGSLAGGDSVERAFQEHTNLLVLVSGGASAMVCAPAGGLTLHDIAHTTELLMRRGVDIYGLNTVRRHLSRIKGGQTLNEEHHVQALLLSDVVGDDPAVIGSGLAAADKTTYWDAHVVLDRHGLLGAVTPAVRTHLELGSAGAYPDTPKVGDPRVANLRVSVIASGQDAAEAARRHAESLGYRTVVLTTTLSGEARDAATWLDEQTVPEGPTALIATGETTVQVQGNGRGGRCQEMALAFAKLRRETPWSRPWTLCCVGTDGRDGPTNAAGALIDVDTVNGLVNIDEALSNNDSYQALDAAGGLLRTGATGTNVGDLIVLLVGA